MKFQQWPKRDPDKNYFKVPNEVFHIGLSYPEISIYCYLLSIEDRETYQCYPSYKTIGKALGMSENTVSKYVRSLEEKGLIRTEPTMVRSKDGRPLNGNLLYTIRPIQAAIELFYERHFQQLEEDAARQRAENTQELLAASVQHIPHSAAKTQRPPFRCSPRPSEVPRGRGQKREDYPAQEPGAAPEHLGQIVGKSGVNASARSVRGSRPRPARNKLSGAYAQALITRRSGSLHRAVFWAHPQRFS